MKRFLIALLGFYKRWLSPALHAISPGGCKFQPTCSEYASEAITIHGWLHGCALAMWRLIRCHPFSPGGFDPVPLPKSRSGTSDPVEPAVSVHKPLP